MKKRVEIKGILIGASIVAIIGVSAIAAYFTDIEEKTNHATMGIVDIALNEYTIKDGKKTEWKDIDHVLPGDTISKIAEISCVEGADDCYVRAKVHISNKNKSDKLDITKSMSKDNLNVNETDWYYCETDGYFYYRTILKDSSDPVVLFSEVIIPSDLGNEWSLEQIDIDVTAEAIQSRNFTPDFTDGSKEPWPGYGIGENAKKAEVCLYPDHVK